MIGRWFVGFVVFVGYLCLGAFVFYRIERKEEEKRHYLEMLERLELKDLLAKHYTQVNAHVRKQFIQQLNVYCNKTVLDEGPDEEVHQYQWTYYNAFFFALTTLSTIGYGNLHPTSCTGRILVLVYSLIGIPLNGIVLTQLGSFFESRILRAHYSYKTQRMMGPQLSLIVDIITYLVPGIIVFILIPSGIIAYFEQWTFDESVYFAFVTLTTIGYGDYVAGQTVNTNIWYNTYKIFLVFWIMFGLGYLFMILSFISRAMRSKTLEHIFLERVKHTHSKIWHQFTKDVVYIRRVLNESYLMKFKPVYKKETLSSGQPLRRSQSAPVLSEWPVMRKTGPPPSRSQDAAAQADDGDEEEDEESVRLRFEKHRMKRRRALSQNRMRSLLRRTKATSEIDLAHIDKEATFGADIASYEILSRVVDALETAVPNQPPPAAAHQQQTNVRGLNDSGNYKKKKAFSFSEGGGQGLSSEDMFANEKNEWTVSGDMLNRENTFIGKHGNPYFEYDTWGGADVQNFKKLNEYTKNGVTGHQRPQQKSRVPKLRRMSAAAFNFLSNNIAPKWLTDRLSDMTGGTGASGGAGHEWTDDPKHRLSVNADGGYYGYGSTCNGNHNCCSSINHGYNNPRPNGYEPPPPPPPPQEYGYNNNNNNNNNRRNRPISMYAPGRDTVSMLQAASSAPEQPRHRRLSSPDPVLAHCANTIAVADFLMTLQRSLDKSSAAVTMQPAACTSSFYNFRRPSAAATCGGHDSRRHHERRSPLFTLFQDRRPSSSAESWQYSSLTSTLSSSTAATTVATDGRLEQPPLPMQLLIPVHAETGNEVLQVREPDGLKSDVTAAVPAKKQKKKRVRRFSIRPTTVLAAPPDCSSGIDVRLDIED